MPQITNEYSSLPYGLLTSRNFKDVTDDIAILVEQVKALQAASRYADAARLIKVNNLQDYVIDAEVMNALDEETRNIEILSKQKKQKIFYMQTEPLTADSYSDVWIGE